MKMETTKKLKFLLENRGWGMFGDRDRDQMAAALSQYPNKALRFLLVSYINFLKDHAAPFADIQSSAKKLILKLSEITDKEVLLQIWKKLDKIREVWDKNQDVVTGRLIPEKKAEVASLLKDCIQLQSNSQLKK